MASYRDDLAYIHDSGYGRHAHAAARFLLAALKKQGIAAGLVVDLGCGSGIVSEAVAAAGFDLLGIDLSAPMLSRARERAPTATFRQESLWSAALPRCVAVACIGECINYRFEPTNRRRDPGVLFRRIHAALEPGGLFVCDLAGPKRLSGTKQHWNEGPDWAVLVKQEEDGPYFTRRIISFRETEPGRYRRDEEVHSMGLWPPSEIASLLRDAGFGVRILRGYDDRLFPPGLTGFLATKKG